MVNILREEMNQSWIQNGFEEKLLYENEKKSQGIKPEAMVLPVTFVSYLMITKIPNMRKN